MVLKKLKSKSINKIKSTQTSLKWNQYIIPSLISQNDPLRSKAYGHKKDYFEKPAIKYPQDNTGVVDEWRALVKTIESGHQKALNEEKERKKLKKEAKKLEKKNKKLAKKKEKEEKERKKLEKKLQKEQKLRPSKL